jgi:TPR repeat protein
MINLGRMHQLGRGMKVDLQEASRWYIRTADAGLTGRARTHLVEAAKRGSDASATWLHDIANSGDPAV